MTRAVFFDFDGTLLPQKNSLSWLFVRALPGAELRNQRTAAFVQAMGQLIPRAALGLIERDAMYIEMIRAIFAGLPVAATRMAGETVAMQVESALYPQMRDVLARHSGDRCFVVTANMEPLLEPFCEARGLTCIGTRLGCVALLREG